MMRGDSPMDRTPTDFSARPQAAAPKLPWERPRVLFREPLETLAAVCQPSPPAKGSPGTCPAGPISS